MARMKRLFFLLLVSVFLNTFLFGQERGKEIRCSTVPYNKGLQEKYPKQIPKDEAFESWMSAKKQEMKASGLLLGEITIPAVVHIIHNGDAIGTNENISDAQILSQIQVLNEDFGKMVGSRGYNSNAVGADTGIEWCLAQVDPSGNPTSGITRTQMDSASWTMAFFDSDVKPVTQWDPTQYCNIWVANLGNNLLGYAQFPSSSGIGDLGGIGGNANTDGIVVTANAFGTKDADDGSFNLSPTYFLGRTLTHEIGHWLGLRHIWGDATCGDDFCSDTPTHQDANYGCPTGKVSCSSTDMVENYMDYTDDGCMNIFTADQKARFDVVMMNSPRRKELVSSNKCTPLTRVLFTDRTTIVKETSETDNGCLDYKDIEIELRITAEPSADVVVSLNAVGGTATEGVGADFIFVNNATFLADVNAVETITLRVFDDPIVEEEETIILNFSLVTSGDATTGIYNQTHTVTIQDNDQEPASFGATTEFYTQNFSGGIPGSWQNLEVLAAGGTWAYSTTAPVNWTGTGLPGSGPAFTSAGNGFILFDSDGRGNDGAAEDAELISAAIDCSNFGAIKLKFEQHFANYQNDISTVGVSNDGVNFMKWELNGALAENAVTNNPDPVELDISAVADGQATVYIMFKYQGNYDFWWAIDDISLEGNATVGIQSTENAAQPQEVYFGPEARVHFFDPNTNNIMITLENLSSHDYGCTTVAINRAGTGAVEAWSSSTAAYIAEKTFRITPSNNNPTGAYNIDLYYDATEISGWEAVTGRLASEAVVIKTQSDITNPQQGDVRYYNLLSSTPFGSGIIFSANFTTGFSDFGIGPDVALPTELSRFNGKEGSEGILLDWQSASEVDTEYFELEHSVNGQDFTRVARIKARGGETIGRAYSYMDKDFNYGDNYYRLKMVDAEGTFEYSVVINVPIDGKLREVIVYPSPVSDEASFSITSNAPEQVVLQVFNTLGVLLVSRKLELKTGVNQFSVASKNWSSGVYFVSVIGQYRKPSTSKFFKE